MIYLESRGIHNEFFTTGVFTSSWCDSRLLSLIFQCTGTRNDAASSATRASSPRCPIPYRTRTNRDLCGLVGKYHWPSLRRTLLLARTDRVEWIKQSTVTSSRFSLRLCRYSALPIRPITKTWRAVHPNLLKRASIRRYL